MIQTTVENLFRYESLNPLFPAAFSALKALSKEAFTKGRHEVDGDHIYINAAEYDTKPAESSCMEHHGRYIDVMWMVSGEEIIGTCPVSQLQEITMPYSEKDDVCLAKLPGCYTELKIKAGDVVILFPEDAHAPCTHLTAPTEYTKLVIKLEL